MLFILILLGLWPILKMLDLFCDKYWLLAEALGTQLISGNLKELSGIGLFTLHEYAVTAQDRKNLWKTALT